MSRFLLPLLVVMVFACNGNGPPPPPPECEATGGQWIDGQCVCPSNKIFQEGVGCRCPDDLPDWDDVDQICLPPRVDQPPQINQVVGVTAFALPLHDRDYITRVSEYVKAAGYNTLRVGFETWRWGGPRPQAEIEAIEVSSSYDVGTILAAAGYLPQGPEYNSPENLANVRRMLDATARVPGIWIELIPVFTIKGIDSPDTPEMRREAVQLAIQLVETGDYKHVFFSYANEWRRGTIQKEEVLWGLRRIGETGYAVTTDCSGDPIDGNEQRVWDPNYEDDFLPLVDMVAFHPRRNPDPTLFDLRRAHRRYVENAGKLASFFNETTSFASDEELEMFPNLQGSFLIANSGRPPEEKRKQQIRDYKERVKSSGPGCRWYYHCISCFMYTKDFEPFWIPTF